jgi:RNA polymerase sigma-70 factor (ECF subfamily)
VHLQREGENIDRAPVVADARHALTEVYRYLHHRCGSQALAEDLTSESLLAAVDRLLAGDIDRISVAYVIGIARHKLVDHWRRAERDRRHLELHRGSRDDAHVDIVFEPDRSAVALAAISPMQRAALTLRYLDDLTVPQVAAAVGRSVPATETLLMRAKRAFRDAYERLEPDDA